MAKVKNFLLVLVAFLFYPAMLAIGELLCDLFGVGAIH